jgi:hypothetical protein
MLPIFEDELSVAEICDRWARASDSTESWHDILAFLEGAWWRGEINWVSGVTCLELLKHMFNWARKHDPGRIVFVTQEDPGPPRGEELPDGGLRLNDDELHRVRIVVPSYDPETWSEASCASTFQALAKTPSSKYYPDRTPGFLSMKLAYPEFVQLLTKHEIDLPKFWRAQLENAPLAKQAPGSAVQSFRKDPSAVASDRPKRGPKPTKLKGVQEAMKRDIQTGKLTVDSLRAMREKQLAGPYGVSRDTARKARNAVLSEFVENSNHDK